MVITYFTNALIKEMYSWENFKYCKISVHEISEKCNNSVIFNLLCLLVFIMYFLFIIFNLKELYDSS